MRRLPRAVVALGVVSLLTDVGSEMVYPLLPLFLTSVLGAGAFSLGLIEGVAESTAAVLKLASGVWSDRARRRLPFVRFGYVLSGAVRPLLALATAWPVVLALRFADRFGKGVRGAPRDALIADVVRPDQRGAAYGLHRSMDNLGAVLGPLVAAALLRLAGLSLGQVFLCTAVPAVAVVVVLLTAVREPVAGPREPCPAPSLVGWRELGTDTRGVLLAVVLFTLGNSADVFLLLRLAQGGVPTVWVAVLWSLHNLVKVAASWFSGRLSDRVGRRPLLVAGWVAHAGVYLGFAVVGSSAGLIGLFLVYGLSFGLAEPAERALVADLAPAHLRGSAFGTFHAAVAAAALPASAGFGLLWSACGAPVAFASGAVLAALATGVLLTVGGGGSGTGPGKV